MVLCAKKRRIDTPDALPNSEKQRNKGGRPPLPFALKKDRAKWGAINNLSAVLKQANDDHPDLLIEALSKCLRDDGRPYAAKVVRQAMRSEVAAKCMFDKNKTDSNLHLTPTESLELLLNCQLSKYQYDTIRLGVNSKSSKLFPCYALVKQAKQQCRPKTGITVTETRAKVELFALVNHTISRIFKLIKTELEATLMDYKGQKGCEFVCSYGFDASTGQKNYKMNYQDPSLGPNSDSSLFVATLIPLRLVSEDGKTYWENPCPQSVRFVRPILLEFAKDTEEYVQGIHTQLKDEISRFESIVLQLTEDAFIAVKLTMLLTLIDGKTLSMLTHTKSMQRCPICDSTPKDFNNLSNIGTDKFRPKLTSLVYGVSPLHCWIRFFEFLLKLSYKMDIKSWQARGVPNKASVEERKKAIQTRMFSELKLRVDFPNSNGSGNSNDGNTARRAFQNWEKFAEILGLRVDIVKDVRTILLTLVSGHDIHPEKFQQFCHLFLQKYISEYGWCFIPVTVHKILIHGAEIIQNTPLAIGKTSEEASEGVNKKWKRFRERNARRMGRKQNLEDVFMRGLDESDPILSSKAVESSSKFRRVKELPQEVLALLVKTPPVVEEERNSDCEDEGDDLINELDGIILENEIEDC